MSLVMVNAGHLTLAKAVANETFYLAWGGIPNGIDQTYVNTIWATNGEVVQLRTTIDVPAARGAVITCYFQNAAGVYVTEKITLHDTDTTTPVQGTKACKIFMAAKTSVAIDSLIVENAAETLCAEVLMNAADIYGDITIWSISDAPPLIDMDIDELYQEFGRRRFTAQTYAYEDPINGTIDANETKWSLTETPTRHLYLQFKFDSSEAPAEILYQLGIFMNSTLIGELPADQRYFVPAEITDPGTIFMAENIKPVARNNATREMFEYIITF